MATRVQRTQLLNYFQAGDRPSEGEFAELINTMAVVCGENVFNPGTNQHNIFLADLTIQPLPNRGSIPETGVTFTSTVTSSLSQTITGGEYLEIFVNNEKRLIPLFRDS